MNRVESPREIAELADQYARKTPERQIRAARRDLAEMFFEKHFGWRRQLGDRFEEAMTFRIALPAWKEQMLSSNVLANDEFGYYRKGLETLEMDHVHINVYKTRNALKSLAEKHINPEAKSKTYACVRRLDRCMKIIGEAIELDGEEIPDGVDTLTSVEKVFEDFTLKAFKKTGAEWGEFIRKPRVSKD